MPHFPELQFTKLCKSWIYSAVPPFVSLNRKVMEYNTVIFNHDLLSQAYHWLFMWGTNGKDKSWTSESESEARIIFF